MSQGFGAQPEGPYRVSNTGLDIVVRLVEPVCMAKRNIVGNNWLTSVPLAKNLIKEKQLTHMPVHFVRTNGRYRKNFRGISNGEKCHLCVDFKKTAFWFPIVPKETK